MFGTKKNYNITASQKYQNLHVKTEELLTQDDIMEITDTLAEDGRFKALDRLDADRKLLLFQVMKITPEAQNNINVLKKVTVLGQTSHRACCCFSWDNHNIYFSPIFGQTSDQ